MKNQKAKVTKIQSVSGKLTLVHAKFMCFTVNTLFLLHRRILIKRAQRSTVVRFRLKQDRK